MKNTLYGLLFLVAGMFPLISHAQVPFGGLDVFEFPCTCSPYMYTVFTPFFLGPVPMSMTLAVPDTPTMFPFFVLEPSAWALGTYTPGGEACWMYVGVGCAPLPVGGMMDPFTGTSLPGGV